MRNAVSIFISLSLATLLILGFGLVTYLDEARDKDAGDLAPVSYMDYDVEDSAAYASPYIGDQANSVALMRTLPLADVTQTYRIENSGINVGLHDVDLASLDVRRNMAFSATVFLSRISDAEFVRYMSDSSVVTIERGFLESRAEKIFRDGGSADDWREFEESIDVLADDLVVTSKSAAINMERF